MLTPAQRRQQQKARATLRDLRRAARKDPLHAPVKPSRGRVRDNAYLAYLRRQPCIAGMVEGGCDGPVEAAHIRFADAKAGWDAPGMQRKPDDSRALPLCRHHHQHDQHRGNERAFWARLGVWPPDLCATLYAAFLADQDGAAVIRSHIRRAA